MVAAPNPCAVEGCEERGRPQVCPYDTKYHHHGMIHYETAERIGTSLTFREDSWYDICNAHYAVLVLELSKHKERVGANPQHQPVPDR